MKLGLCPPRLGLRHGIVPLAWLLLAVSFGPALGHAPLRDEIQTASRRITSAPDRAAEFLVRGELHRLAGDWEAARADYDRAAALNPAVPGLGRCRAALLLDQGQFAAAHAALTRLLEQEPGEPRAWELRSRASEALGHPEAAAQDLGRAIQVSTDPPPDLYVERSRLLVAAGLQNEALRSLEDGVSRLGPIVSLELAAVDLEVARANYAGALARLDRVAAQMERPEKLLARRAEILGAAGSPEAARVAREASAIGASNAGTLFSTADSDGSTGKAVARPSKPEAPSLATATGRESREEEEESSADRLGVHLAAPSQVAAEVVTRGPYLQIGTPTGVTIRWRTDQASTSRVVFGTSIGALTSKVEDLQLTTEHEITLTGMTPDQRYYYAIGTASAILEGDDAAHSFVTSPVPGTRKPTRVWIIGDAGTRTSSQAAVRDAFTAYSASRPPDLWLMLGDNAYSSGTDSEYQGAVFDMYRTILKNTVLWPTRGNHDTIQSGFDYYDIFSMPKSGQAGGLASGTEAYYSFDYGNIHFICLDSQGSNRSSSGTMATWLRNDIAATAREWVIAFWHHPPYSKGSHNSDSESELIQMRENILPILESAGVDVVFCGHSHSYERSFLLDGHYGTSTTLTDAMKVDPGNGRESGDGPYEKATLGTGPHEGAVYTVAGSSGKTSGGSLNHPVMVTSLNVLGSVVVDVAGDRLDARFLDNNRVVRDNFTIIKGRGGAPDTILPAAITDLGVPGSSSAAPAAAGPKP